MYKDIKRHIYFTLHPDLLLLMRRYHLTKEETNEVFRIFSDMKAIKDYIKMIDIRDRLLNDYLIICELCSIKDKRYLKVITPYIIEQVFSDYRGLYRPPNLAGALVNLVDYESFGCNIYFDMVQLLWNNRHQYVENVPAFDKEFNEFMILTVKKFENTYLGENHVVFMIFLKIYLGYLYLNRYQLDAINLIHWFNKIMDKEYYNHLLLNGAFADKEGFNYEIMMYYINEIIDLYNKSNNLKSRDSYVIYK